MVLILEIIKLVLSLVVIGLSIYLIVIVQKMRRN